MLNIFVTKIVVGCWNSVSHLQLHKTNPSEFLTGMITGRSYHYEHMLVIRSKVLQLSTFFVQCR